MKVWIFVATGPCGWYATEQAIVSLRERLVGCNLELCLSAQTEEDYSNLVRIFSAADVFEPDFSAISHLSGESRYRSAMHSEILNQGWARRSDADFVIVMDNDLYFSGSDELTPLLYSMMERGLAVVGAGYPKVSWIRRLFGREQDKPLGIPNCIFSVINLEKFSLAGGICSFSELLGEDSDPRFDEDQGELLAGKRVDAGNNLYLHLIKNKLPYEVLSCQNIMHPYYPGSMLNFFAGGDSSPELYRFDGIDLVINHFKKLSFFKDCEERAKAYFKWLKKMKKL